MNRVLEGCFFYRIIGNLVVRLILGRWCISFIIFFLFERSGCIGYLLIRGYIYSIEFKGFVFFKFDIFKI